MLFFVSSSPPCCYRVKMFDALAGGLAPAMQVICISAPCYYRVTVAMLLLEINSIELPCFWMGVVEVSEPVPVRVHGSPSPSSSESWCACKRASLLERNVSSLVVAVVEEEEPFEDISRVEGDDVDAVAVSAAACAPSSCTSS